MPTRLLREGILESLAVNALSLAAEVFFRRLMSRADDFGRYHGHASLLRAACFPLKLDSVSDGDVEAWLAECSAAGVVRVYEVNNQRFVEIRKFCQRVRAATSKFPAPPDDDGEPRTNDGAVRADDSDRRANDRSSRISKAEAEAPPEPKPRFVDEDARLAASDSDNGTTAEAGAEVSAFQKQETPSSDLWPAWWDLFVKSGKPLNDRDKEKALRVWVSKSPPEQLQIFQWTVAQFISTWLDPKHTPTPASALNSEGWTRKAAPRTLHLASEEDDYYPLDTVDPEVKRRQQARDERLKREAEEAEERAV